MRRELAQCVHWLPDDARLAQIVQALLSDASSEVRKAMAWQACNMSDHKELKELFVQAATMDPDETVRGDALSGIDRLLPLPDVVNLIQQRLPNEPSQAVHWGAFAAMRDHVQEPEARGMIEQLTRSPHAQVSRAAREALA